MRSFLDIFSNWRLLIHRKYDIKSFVYLSYNWPTLMNLIVWPIVCFLFLWEVLNQTDIKTWKSSRQKCVQHVWEQLIPSFSLISVSMEESVDNKAEKYGQGQGWKDLNSSLRSLDITLQKLSPGYGFSVTDSRWSPVLVVFSLSCKLKRLCGLMISEARAQIIHTELCSNWP